MANDSGPPAGREGSLAAPTRHAIPWRDPDFFDEASLVEGSPAPAPLDVAAVRWAEEPELRDELFPPADVPVLAKVRARLTLR